MVQVDRCCRGKGPEAADFRSAVIVLNLPDIAVKPFGIRTYKACDLRRRQKSSRKTTNSLNLRDCHFVYLLVANDAIGNDCLR